MNDQPAMVSTKQLIATICALLFGCFVEASSDWIAEQVGKNLTAKSIIIDAAGLFLVGLIIGVPVAMLFWNKLLSPIFGVPRVLYVHALVLVTAAYWINGL